MATKTTTKEAKKTKAMIPFLTVPVYSQDGKEVSTVDLPGSVFDAPWRADLVHQVVTSMEGNARARVAHTKDRGEVRGGGRKPWKQKGTGRARHGSSRSPIWKGGGITFGPRSEKKFERSIPKRMRAEALASVLSKKLEDGELMFVDSIALSVPKTKGAKVIMDKLAGVKGFNRLNTKRKNAALILLNKKSDAVWKSFRNIGSIAVDETRNVNASTALKSTYLVIEKPKDAIVFFTSRLEK